MRYSFIGMSLTIQLYNSPVYFQNLIRANVRMSEEMSRIFWSGTFYGLDKAKVLSEDLENQTNFNG